MIEEFQAAAKWWAENIRVEPVEHPHIKGFKTLSPENLTALEQAIYVEMCRRYLPNWDKDNPYKGALSRSIFTEPRISSLLERAAYRAMIGGLSQRLPGKRVHMEVQPGIVTVMVDKKKAVILNRK